MLWDYAGNTDSTPSAGERAPSQAQPVTRAAAPQAAAAPAFNGWYDPAKLDAYRATMKPGADGRTIVKDEGWLQALNPVSGITGSKGQYIPGHESYGDGGSDVAGYYQGGNYRGPNNQLFNEVSAPAGQDPNGNYIQWSDNSGGGWQNSTGSARDRVQPIYKLDANGNATPVSAGTSYQPSGWVDWGRDLTKIAGTVLSAGAAGYAAAGYGAAGVGGATAGGGATGAAADFGVGTYAAGAGAAEAGAGAAAGAGASGAAAVGGAGAGAAEAAGAAGITQLAPVTITGAAPAATGGLTLGQAAGAASAVGGAASAAGGSGGTSDGMSSADRAALNSNTGYTGSAGGTGSTIGDMAKSAGQSVADFLKTPAGAKAALALAGAAYGSANAGTAPKPGVNGAGGGTVGDVAGLQLTLAQQNAARAAQLQGASDPLYAQLIKANTDQAGKLGTQSNNQFSSYNADFAPIETKYAQTALNYDTAGRREQEAQIAVGDQATRFAAARDERNRTMSANGVDPSSGKAMAFDNAARIEQAKAEAGGANTARRQVENTGLSLMQNAANFGQTKVNTGLGLSNAATNTGNAAASLANQQQASSNNTAQTTSGLFGNVSSSLGTQANINNGLFNQQQTAYENKNAQTADWLGAAGQIAGSYFSSKQLKNEVGGVDKEKAAIAVASTPIHAWTYKPGAVPGDDGSLKIGKYAEDSQAATGLGDGTKLDAASENGLNQATLQFLLEREAKRDPKLRKKLAAAMALKNKSPGLADARRMR